MKRRLTLISLVIGFALGACAIPMVTDSDEVAKGADLVSDTVDLPSDTDPECVAQTLYESDIADEVMDLLRDLGSRPDKVETVTIDPADMQKINEALEAATGYCRDRS